MSVARFACKIGVLGGGGSGGGVVFAPRFGVTPGTQSSTPGPPSGESAAAEPETEFERSETTRGLTLRGRLRSRTEGKTSKRGTDALNTPLLP